MRSEQIGPFRRSNENFIDNFGSCMRFERFVSVSSSDQWNERNRTLTSLKFGSHDGLSRDGYVVSRTHWGISRSDNRHSMRTIWRIQLWNDTTQAVSAGRVANLGSEVRLTFGFHTRTCKGPSSIGLSNTGAGHCHWCMMMKNLETRDQKEEIRMVSFVVRKKTEREVEEWMLTERWYFLHNLSDTVDIFSPPTSPKLHHHRTPWHSHKSLYLFTTLNQSPISPSQRYRHRLKGVYVCVNSRCAQSLIVLKASLNTATSGTNLNISSVTLLPPKLLTHRSSKFLNKLSSFNSNSSGIEGSASRENNKSISMPEIVHLIIGTKASGTDYMNYSLPFRISIGEREREKRREETAYGNF